MSNVLIPTVANELAYSIRTTLSGSDFVFAFEFNQAEGFWYFDLLDASEAPIVQGVKVVLDFPLLVDVTDPRRPLGDIVALDSTGKGIDAGQDDLSPPTPRVSLVYLDTP